MDRRFVAEQPPEPQREYVRFVVGCRDEDGHVEQGISYVAAATDDLAKFRSLIARGFDAFDNGERYDGDALMQMVISAHAKGMKIVWNVTKPDAHVHGDYAWIAYTNVGSIQVSAGAGETPMTWLESACLERHNGSWKIVFVQSSRVPAPPPSGSR